jgi:hypothetical protein
MPDDMCPCCGHEWRRYDPGDGRCDALQDEDHERGIEVAAEELARWRPRRTMMTTAARSTWSGSVRRATAARIGGKSHDRPEDGDA